MLLKNLIWPNKEKALRSRLLCHFGKVCDGPYSFHTRGLFQCSKSRTGYLKLLCIIMANVISREGRLEPLGKCFPFFCGFSCIVPRNFCRFLEDVCVCVCVCVFSWSRNLQEHEIFQGTFLHLTPAERSQGNTWSSRAGLALLCWPDIAKAHPAVFSSVPHRKIQTGRNHSYRGFLLQSALLLRQWGKDRFSGRTPAVCWEWGFALQRLWRKETVSTQQSRYLDGIRSPEDLVRVTFVKERGGSRIKKEELWDTEMQIWQTPDLQEAPKQRAP